jgi:hypothetical protein
MTLIGMLPILSCIYYHRTVFSGKLQKYSVEQAAKALEPLAGKLSYSFLRWE